MTTTSSSPKTRKRRRDTGVVLVARDRHLLCSLYAVPMTREQLQRLYFPGCTAKPSIRRLTKLARGGFVFRRRLPHVQAAGAAAYCYSLGTNAIPYVATEVDVPSERVKRRQEKDARLSLLTYPHRALTAETYIAFVTGCDSAGVTLRWFAEHELTPDVVEHQGKRLPVRPDGAVLLRGLPQGSSFAYLEIQVASDPSKFVRKALGYALFYRSGRYQERSGRKSFRVLTITTSKARAHNLCEAVSNAAELRAVGGLERLWFTWQEALVSDVWGQIWLRADVGTDTQFGVLG